jgi:peptide subunit release factor 1 (eRF1)
MAFKNTIKELSMCRSLSTGTSLVTLFIPSGYQMSLVSKTLASELSTSVNIKNKHVRNDTIISLKSAQELIKKYNFPKAPKNGLVVCSGKTTCCF